MSIPRSPRHDVAQRSRAGKARPATPLSRDNTSMVATQGVFRPTAVVRQGPSGTGATGTWGGHSSAGESGFVGVRPGFLVALSAHIEVDAEDQSNGDGQQPVPEGRAPQERTQ
jgi:hypothetical protein